VWESVEKTSFKLIIKNVGICIFAYPGAGQWLQPLDQQLCFLLLLEEAGLLELDEVAVLLGGGQHLREPVARVVVVQWGKLDETACGKLRERIHSFIVGFGFFVVFKL
jgi:hypothetical protein